MFAALKRLRLKLAHLLWGERWKSKTLVVGPSAPVDGDSVASVKALILHLRKQGKQAYTLPTLAMTKQLEWILSRDDLHPALLPATSKQLTTANLQAAYDLLLTAWQPDEIVLLDGQLGNMGFDPRSVPVYTIDHHLDHGTCDDGSGYIQRAPAAGCLLIEHFGIYEPILAVAIITDTFWLRQNFPADAIRALHLLTTNGLSNELLGKYQTCLKVPKSPEVIAALRTADLREIGDAVFCVITQEASLEIHRDVTAALGYYYCHLCVVGSNGYISFRTNNQHKNLRSLAARWGRGGHPQVCAGQLPSHDAGTIDRLYAEFMSEVLDPA